MRVVLTLALALALAACPIPAAAEMSLGLTGGASLPDLQNTVLKRFGPDGQQLHYERPDTDVDAGPFVGLTATWWASPRAFWGVQLDALYWTTATSLSKTPPDAFREFTQTRAALFASLLMRLRLGDLDDAFLYGGLGGGLVATRLSTGERDLGPGAGLVGGIAFPLNRSLRLRLETRYLITSDVEADPKTGWRPETSGVKTLPGQRFLFGPHFDTGFFTLGIGLDWIWAP